MSKSGIVFTGDWRRAQRLFNELGSTVEEVNESIRGMAEELADNVKSMIPRYADPYNAPSTIKRKGVDAPLMEDGGLKDAIDVFDYSDYSRPSEKKIYYIVKGNPDIDVESGDREHYVGSKGNPLTYEQLLEILENGSPEKGIPARPLLTLVWSINEQKVISSVTRTTEGALKRRLNRL